MQDLKGFSYLEGGLIGAQLVVGDELWYVERYSEDSILGSLKIRDLNEESYEISGIPQVKALHLHGSNILAVGRNTILEFDSEKHYYCSLLSYEYDQFSLKKEGIKLLRATDECPKEVQSVIRSRLIPIGGTFQEGELLWFGAGKIRNPMGHSRDFSLIGGGLYVLDLIKYDCHQKIAPNELLEKENITCISKKKGDLLLGTSEGRLIIYSPKQGISKYMGSEDGMRDASIMLIHPFKKETWIASSLGYLMYDHKKDQVKQYDHQYQDNYFEIVFDKQDQSWKKDSKMLGYNPPYNSLITILETKKKNYYGTLLGLYIHDKKNKCWTHHQEDTGFPSNRVRSLSSWKDQVIVGTDKGLYKFKSQ